jgi:hypothetical protein
LSKEMISRRVSSPKALKMEAYWVMSMRTSG